MDLVNLSSAANWTRLQYGITCPNPAPHKLKETFALINDESGTLLYVGTRHDDNNERMADRCSRAIWLILSLEVVATCPPPPPPPIFYSQQNTHCLVFRVIIHVCHTRQSISPTILQRRWKPSPQCRCVNKRLARTARVAYSHVVACICACGSCNRRT